jgi:putative N-acetylmannosamine-6-phosphate epimerase
MIFLNRLVASCQDNPEWTIKMALQGGAGGLRVNGVESIRIAKKADGAVPIIACAKIDREDTSVRITPTVVSAVALAEAGATLVAFDATATPTRLRSVADMVAAIREHGAMCVADVSTVKEGMDAWSLGVDLVATTLFTAVDYDAIQRLANNGVRVMAEGNIRTPKEAKRCVEHGAEFVCVGSAISRPHHVTSWFVEALK